LVKGGWHVAAIGLGNKPEAITDCVDLTGNRFSITQLAALMNTCQLFIGIDRFPMHAAQAMGLPTIGLFGCTSARYIMTHGSPHMALEADPSIPCAGHRHRTYGAAFVDCSSDCINSMKVEQVLAAVEKITL
jgi:ADP-heptose:LPS heptosyltransferase